MKNQLDKLNDFYILNDVISPMVQDLIESYMLGDDVYWESIPDITYDLKTIKRRKITELTPAARCEFVVRGKLIAGAFEGGRVIHPSILNCTQTILESACLSVGLEPKKILQARSFKSFPPSKKSKREHNTPHVDLKQPHFVCLYYVNDSDGDTVFFDKTSADITTNEEYTQAIFGPICRVAPKKGRAIIFNGNRYHSSSSPSENVRCIINFDFAV